MPRKDAGGKRGTAEAGAEVEAALDELYSTPPAGFVSRREELALRARTDGRAEDARRIHAARRPSLAAWTANLLRRSLPQESRRFLELGEALREAYGALDRAGIKELSVRRRSVVAALSGQAARLAAEAGQRLSASVRQEVEATLQAVLADPGAAEQWAAGRLETALTPPSDLPAGSAPPSRAARTAPARPAARAPAKDDLAERRRERERQLAQEAAEAAEGRLRERRTELAEADGRAVRAVERHDRAEEEVTAAERRLHAAREELQLSRQERREAEERQRAASDALTRAEREAREATREAQRAERRGRR
ncbi:hypothetical protein NFX46_15815 [Streptomyces phaeoluteigriseus]|uniref:Uncharacterized protein n=1 Tax=Streptomyces phaeoluteigriseus TaxID=114686 RepID=A0ABY4Z8U1_9ACTN|nr:hypothetical protein [Streptomyces phaeoluteigriseus]USQ85125.1 hypothetical protein NFX46_15815 [Streptomyces phaeoluteigriseus]